MIVAYMTRSFARYVRREGIPGATLAEAVARIATGSIDADLGGGLIKQRVARPGAGRSGGWRTIIVYRSGEVAIFVHGFAKKAKANVSQKELAELKRLASVMLALTAEQVRVLVDDRAWIEVSEEDGDEALQE